MHIKLISPRMTLRPMDSQYKRVMSPSISLLILAALTPREHTVEIADENIGKIPYDDRPDLVGISVNVDTARHAYAIAEHYRRKQVPVILGGIHASACPDEALEHGDSVCIGEAEHLWEGILADVQNGGLQKRYYYDQPSDPARVPLPRWELVNQNQYLYTSILCATRGCPFQCEFCYNSCRYVHHHYRTRPIEHVLEEIRRLGTREVMFIDDNFIGNIAWTRKLVRAMIPMRLRWHCAVSSNIVKHPGLMAMMKEAGCESLFIGFESINPHSLVSVNKRQNHIGDYETLIGQIHRLGMMVNASMVFGLDDDYPDVFDNTLDWLVRNKVETVTSHILTPYPGTLLHERLEREGRIIDRDLSHYNTAHVVYHPKHMSADMLYRGYLRLYRQFYSLKNILKRLPESKAQRVPYLMFNLIYRKYGKLTSLIGKLGLMGSLGRFARRLCYGIE